MLKYTSPPLPRSPSSPLTLSSSPHPLCKWFWLFRKLLTLQHLIARTTFVSLGCQCMKKSFEISKKKYVKHKKKHLWWPYQSTTGSTSVRQSVTSAATESNLLTIISVFFFRVKTLNKMWWKGKKVLGEGTGIQLPASMCVLYESWVWLLILYEKNVWIANITK